MASKKKLLSVGYRFRLDAEVLNAIMLKVENPESYNADHRIEIFAGVWYSSNCCKGPQDCTKTDTELRSWFAKRSDQTLGAFLRQIYVHKKFIIGVMDCENERFFAMLVDNRSGFSTTALKKACNSGQFGHPIDVGRLNVRVTPFIDEQK